MMNVFYESLVTRFESLIAKLDTTEACTWVSQLARNLAEYGFESIIPQELARALDHKISRRVVHFLNQLQHAYVLYANHDLAKARQIADYICVAAMDEGDGPSMIDALHLQGRIHFDLKAYDDAAKFFAEEMNWAQRLYSAAGFIRAVHELSRIHTRRYELLSAEFGFRLAFDFHIASCTFNRQSNDDAPGSDMKNAEAAVKCLRSLSEAYMMVANGPIEGDALIAKLHTPYLSTQDGTADAFLELRGLSVACLAWFPQNHRFIERMLSRAMSLHDSHPQVSFVYLDEAEFAGDLIRPVDSFPYVVRRSLARSVNPPALNKEAFFKPAIEVREPCAEPNPFHAPELAARDAATLYLYLANADRSGRYVYRGQTVEYPGPLLPSAFRSILTNLNGCIVMDSSDPLCAKFSLRRCGRRFIGEYNTCFRQYANPVRHLIHNGAAAGKIQASFDLYQKIIDGIETRLCQEGTFYKPWIDAVHQCLSLEELSLFYENQDQWMILFNNFHRRQYRMDRLIDLFDYTLGTTFAQQYGLSSEGLDATKSLDVALFFATRESRDFRTIKSSGIGVVYRFPFPLNDVASSPLQKYDYYTLPSIVDVKDVIYRLEMDKLSPAESRRCLDVYIGAHYIDNLRNPNLLFLPEGFYKSTRVAKQHAVIIFPDEIREDHADRKPGVGGISLPKYRFIEDLSARDGVEKFYFQHTGDLPERVASIPRESLWPREDALLETIVRIILGRYPLHMQQAKRLDLLDVGFENERFAKEAGQRYWVDRPVYYSEQQQLLASKNFSLVL